MSDFIHRTYDSTYFFTIRLANGSSDLLVRKIAQLRNAMRDTKARHPFHIDAITVLPAAIHTLWTLPQGEDNYRRRIAMFKSGFSRAMSMPAGRTLAQIKRGEKGIWQRHVWEHQIKDVADFERHRDLIYLSPVHAGLCPKPQDWPHCSIHRDLRDRRTTSAPICLNVEIDNLGRTNLTASKESLMPPPQR